MGRASGGKSSAVLSDVGRRTPQHPVGWVTRWVAGYHGIHVVGHGYLDEGYGGHPAGTAYVDIAAKTITDCETSQHILGADSGLPELAWEHGWTQCRLANGQRGLRLRLFPTP